MATCSKSTVALRAASWRASHCLDALSALASSVPTRILMSYL